MREFIECFWHVSGEYGYGRERILPTGTVELLLNLSEPYKHFDVDAPTRFHWNRDAWICGLQSRYLLSEGSGKTDMLGVRFRLNGIDAFSRFTAAEFAGRVVDAESVWGTLVRELIEQLHETPKLPEKFALLDEFFLSKLIPPRQPQWLRVALSLLARSQGSLSIGSLASSVEVSHKQLILQFRKRVGLPPKKLARVLRFNRTLRGIDAAGQPTEVAMIRSILSVLSGPVVYGLACVPINTAVGKVWPDLVREDGSTTHVGLTALFLVLHVGYSTLAGFAGATVAPGFELRHAAAQATLQLAIAAFVAVKSWNIMPAWYHISFLILFPCGIFLGVLLEQQLFARSPAEAVQP